MLIINKQTGQWGTEYHQEQDLGRVEMKGHSLDSAQEVMSLSFDDIKRDSAEFHIRWAKTDESSKDHHARKSRKTKKREREGRQGKAAKTAEESYLSVRCGTSLASFACRFAP